MALCKGGSTEPRGPQPPPGGGCRAGRSLRPAEARSSSPKLRAPQAAARRGMAPRGRNSDFMGQM